MIRRFCVAQGKVYARNTEVILCLMCRCSGECPKKGQMN